MLNPRALAQPLMVVGAVMAVLGTTLALLAAARRAPDGRLVAREDTIIWEDNLESPHPRGPVTLRFVLRNEGGRPVRIREASSSCGCAKPRLETLVVDPGKESSVFVDATPFPVGEKTARVSLTTDSALTPSLTLTAKMYGYAKPPFLLQAGGDLTYLGETAGDQERRITVVTVEPEGESLEPVIENPNEFIEIAEPNIVTAPYTKPGVVYKTYTYLVSPRQPPPEGQYLGEVVVVDPWDPTRRERLRVVSENVPDIRSIPRQLSITTESASDPRGVNFIVALRNESDGPVVVEPSETLGTRAEVVPASEDRSAGLARFNLRPKNGFSLPPGKHSIVVRPPPPSDKHLVIPVIVAED